MTTGHSFRNPWRRVRLIFLAGLLLSGGCARRRSLPEPAPPAGAYPTAAIVASGAIQCFCAGLKFPDGQLATCEISAAVRDGNRLVLGSDKPVPGGSPVFGIPLTDGLPRVVPCDQPEYFTAVPFMTATKYEDLTRTPDGAFLLATTGFDRYDHASARFDPYDTLLCWPAGEEGQVTAVNPARREGITSSTGIWQLLSRIQASPRFPRGAPYFKVEGLAAIPGDRLLFGIREVGKNYRRFDYTVRIVEVPYTRSDHQITLSDKATVVFDLNGKELARQFGLRAKVGLSSLEYDPVHDRLYLLTSFELSQDKPVNGGYLWVIPMSSLKPGGRPVLVRQADGAPLLFTHKPEAVAVIDEKTVIIIHDDDRVMGGRFSVDPAAGPGRAANQSFYDLVRFEE